MEKKLVVKVVKKTAKSSSTNRSTMVRLIFSVIRENRLYRYDSKTGAPAVIDAVRKQFPNTKFNVTQYPWYLSRYRRQRSLGLPLDRIVAIPALA